MRQLDHIVSQLVGKIIPTPSQPMESWNRLLAEVRITMVIRHRSKYLINQFRCRSECIYHVENSMIDHVTNRATGRKIIEKSNLKLRDKFIGPIVIQCQLVIINSVSELKNEDSGIRLIKNAYLMHRVT